MGQKFIYKCNNCGYSVETSGGHDIGMFPVMDTYICKICKEIVDVMVGFYGKTYSKQQILIKKQNKELEDDLNFFTCPKCKSHEDLIKWKVRKEPCPKCDGKMALDVNKHGMLWD